MAGNIIDLQNEFETGGQRYRIIPAPRVINDITKVEKIIDQTADQSNGAVYVDNGYKLESDAFYNLGGDWDQTEGDEESLTLDFNKSAGCAGRFTAWADDLTLNMPEGVYIPDENSASLSIVEGHTYEFNVWIGSLIITDVTYTAPATEGGE